jgi:hypothetical protein
MRTTIPVAVIAPIILNLGYNQASTFASPTAVSVLVDATESQPTVTFQPAQIDSAYLLAMDWLDLSKTVLADAQPLTAEERSSINDFFWSHF